MKTHPDTSGKHPSGEAGSSLGENPPILAKGDPSGLPCILWVAFAGRAAALCVGELQRGAKSLCALQLEGRKENHIEKSLLKRKIKDSSDSRAAHMAQQQILVWKHCVKSV